MAQLAYEMFDLTGSAADARRMDRLQNIYHRGQDLAWNGREVLAELVRAHGGVDVPADKRAALRNVLGMLMWGELAAWRVSAQLADRIDPLGAKMAATSQAHDEARHFYVLHDYLELAAGGAPARPYPASERLLEFVLATDDLPSKLLGMQLQVETAALTIFQHLRESRVCPVLSDLLLFFEKDEARHVGLGMQYLPLLIRKMDRLESARFTASAVKISWYLLGSNRAAEPDLEVLGLDPRRMLQLGASKQTIVFNELWATAPGSKSRAGDAASAVLQAVANAMWPPKDERHLAGRARAFARALRQGVEPVPTSIDPSA